MNQGIYGFPRGDGNGGLGVPRSARDVVLSWQRAPWSWAQALSTGAAQVGYSSSYSNVSTGTTAGSYGYVSLMGAGQGAPAWGMTNNYTVDWSRPKGVYCRFVPRFVSTNGVFRLKWGGYSSGPPMPAESFSKNGISMEIRNRRVWFTAHNNATLKEVDTGYDIPTASLIADAFDVLLLSDGLGVLTATLVSQNNRMTFTIPGAPTFRTTDTNHLWAQISNGTDATNCEYFVGPPS